jgi:hypothetical protein
MKDLQYNLNAWAQAGVRDDIYTIPSRKKKLIAHSGKAVGLVGKRQRITPNPSKQLTLFEK